MAEVSIETPTSCNRTVSKNMIAAHCFMLPAFSGAGSFIRRALSPEMSSEMRIAGTPSWTITINSASDGKKTRVDRQIVLSAVGRLSGNIVAVKNQSSGNEFCPETAYRTGMNRVCQSCWSLVTLVLKAVLARLERQAIWELPADLQAWIWS